MAHRVQETANRSERRVRYSVAHRGNKGTPGPLVVRFRLLPALPPSRFASTIPGEGNGGAPSAAPRGRMAMTTNADDTFVRVTNGLMCGFRVYFNGLQKVMQTALPGLDSLARARVFGNESLRGRLDAIDQAQASVALVNSQLAELRRQAEQHQSELKLALDEIKEIQAAKPDLTEETAGLEKIATLDTGAFRELIGTPSALDVWYERALGFCSGIVACLLVWLLVVILQAVF